MRSATDLRREVESALADRIPAALSFRRPTRLELSSCGLAEVDAALGGGFPLGGISELTGSACSGRTTLTLATLAGITQQGGTCAYVDVSDNFDPASGASLGIDLRRLLWVRVARAGFSDACPAFSTNAPTASTAKSAVEQQAVGEKEKKSFRGGWRHPRTEVLGMDRAIGQLFDGGQKASRSSSQSHEVPRGSESIPRPLVDPVLVMPPVPARSPSSQPTHVSRKPWLSLDQALRATDLLLNAGGFRAIVLDMGEIHPEQARRVPLTTWYRFRLQVEKASVLFLLLTRLPCAGSCAVVSVGCDQAMAQWRQVAGNGPSLLTGLGCRMSVARNRADMPHKKPAASAPVEWCSAASWMR